MSGGQGTEYREKGNFLGVGYALYLDMYTFHVTDSDS